MAHYPDGDPYGPGEPYGHEWQDACTHAAIARSSSPAQHQLTEAETAARDMDRPETDPHVMQRDFLGTP